MDTGDGCVRWWAFQAIESTFQSAWSLDGRNDVYDGRIKLLFLYFLSIYIASTARQALLVQLVLVEQESLLPFR